MIKKKILIITGRYLPGYKDGGPVRSIKNLTDYLGDEYEFRILTCDRDHGDTLPYSGVKVNDWNKVGKAMVYYVPPGGFSFKIIRDMASQSDIVYMCGCFNDYAIHTLLLKRFNMIKCPVIVASMGLFSPMEFRIKYVKKKLFTTIFSILGMFRSVYWSVTSEMEKRELQLQIKVKENYFIAEDLPRKVEEISIQKEKNKRELKVVWISRITPKKNLEEAIEIIGEVEADIIFDIYGSIQDERYWEVCYQKLKKLPVNIQWKWCGNLDSEKVIDTLKQYHIFLFPTLGENYGHVIQEALSAGCAVLLSDQTPWKDLEQAGVGYAFSLKNRKLYVETIEKYAAMKTEEIQNIADRAVSYVAARSNDRIASSGYREMFDAF